MKRTILLFTAALLLSMASAFAQGGTTGPLTWKINNGTLTISGEGAMPDYNPVASIPWFNYQNALHTIVIESGVTSIGGDAFFDCTNLTSITIPNTVTKIGIDAFYKCISLTSIPLPDGLISIAQGAFRNCTNLSSILLPKTLASIEFYSPFSGCTNLTSIDVENENNTFASENGVLFDKSKNTLILYPQGRTGTYIIPSGVTIIGYSAFSNCSKLTSITIPSSITSIMEYAFYGCSNLTSITIPHGVTSIGRSAFAYCSSLTTIAIPNSVTSIKDYAFENCTSLISINFPNSLTSISYGTCWECRSLTTVTIPSSVVSIGLAAFIFCYNLTLITNLNPVPVDISCCSVFDYVNINACTLEVPIGSVTAYKESIVWKNFNIVGIDVGIEPLEADIVKIYPNPTTGELRVESGEWRVES